MSNAAVGKPSYNNGFVKRKAWYLEEGDNHARILPPVKSLADKGVWAIYETIHWGILNSEGKKRTYKCIQVMGKDKMIKTRCPMCDLYAEKLHERNTKEQELKSAGKSDDSIKVALKQQDAWLKAFNKDSKWYVNILKPNGEIGRLSFAHTYKKLMDELITKMVNPPKGKKPVDPIASDEGVIFNFFYKKGTQKTRVQTVSVYTEEQEFEGGVTAEVVKKLPLTENVLNRLESEAWDLVGMNKVLTSSQIQQLVDSNFDASLVDAMYANATVKDSADEDEPASEEESAPATLPVKKAAAPEQETKTEVKPEPKQDPKPAKNQSMTDDDFFKKFGGK